MAKVFRIHEGQDGTGWFSSNPISKTQLKTVKTEGRDVATSIPSPFARIDLVKSAFRWVADNGIKGSTAQHKLVSDALDVAQLFFIYPKHKDKIRIVSWNPADRFENLSGDNNLKHQTFAETLKVFWHQDSRVYNFDKVKRLYFLLNNANEVIGGTSPATMFFAAPDVRKAVLNLTITCGHDVLFDNNFASLPERDDKSFIEYIFLLSKQPDFVNYFPELYSYLTEALKNLDPVLQAKIADLSPASIKDYSPCPVLNNEMDVCEVLGIPLCTKMDDPQEIEAESDFVMNSELPVSGHSPLVLPYDRFAGKWTYTTKNVSWNPNNQIPYRNEAVISVSKLPVQGDHYPWLTIGNFLEDKIIELPYTIDNRKFKVAGANKHLLPLTPVFFQYFRTESVPGHLSFSELAGGGIEVKLNIPVKGGQVVFKKTYHKEDIVKMEIHLAVLPFLRTSAIDLDYTLALQDKRFNRSQHLFLECFEKGSKTITTPHVVRKQGEGNTIRSTYCKTKSFDAIRVCCDAYSGFIVPSMYESAANQRITFAIDFGTTNTHIEYKFEGSSEKAIDVSYELPMWQSLIDRRKEETKEIADDNNYEREIFPYQFNNSTDYKFPFRTALTYNKDINFSQPVDVFTHTNNFFLFEKLFYPNYLKLQTKLKWSNYANHEDRVLVESYIEGLVYMVLYKTLLLNGDPRNTKITWFYPVSMDAFEQGVFFDVWQKAFQKIFKTAGQNNIRALPESIAPYLYYRTAFPGLSLSIDIGGGSSDIAVFKNASNSPEFISSFKFAGNAIFGDGFYNSAFTNSSDNNGFVKSYRKNIENTIAKGSQREQILSDILEERKDSSDFSSFLFSLENEKDIKFSFTDFLKQDRKLKLPILVFYAAVIYYSSNLLKKYRVEEIPKNILFSGTASKTLKIIDPQKGSPNISNLFRYFFRQVMSVESGHLNIALADNPKEITCKGVLRADINEDVSGCPIIFWVGGNDESVWSRALNKNTDVAETPYYRDLDINNNKILIEASINTFFTMLDDYFRNNSLEGDFGIDNSAYLIFKQMRSLNIRDFLEQGLKAFFKNPDKHIEETLFFYPLIGILNKLSNELANAVK